MIDRGTVLFVVSEDWYFVSHRLQLVPSLQRAGYQIVLASRFTTHRDLLESAGVRCIPIALRRRRRRWRDEAAAIRELRRIYQREQPVIVHHVALKPVIYGGIAARRLPGLARVHAIAGLGLLVSWTSWKGRLTRRLAVVAMRFALGGPRSWVMVQNPEDRAVLERERIVAADRIALVRGAGVDLAVFTASPEPPGPPVILFAGRMLRDKGVAEFVAAARALRASGVNARFWLAGEPDADNPLTIAAETLRSWHDEGVVEWLGRVDDMPQLFRDCHVVCLPTTYGEGIPKVLLEAAASARPIVATDWPGCREVVVDEHNGILVAPAAPSALAAALRRLALEPATRLRMGQEARRKAEREFGLDLVANAVVALYRRAAAAT